MRAALIFPPAWSVVAPYPSLPVLTSFLREQDIDVRQFDLNCECFDHLLSGAEINRAMPRFHKSVESLVWRNVISRSVGTRLRHTGEELAERIDEAKLRFRREQDFYEPEALDGAWNTLEEAFRFYSMLSDSESAVLQPFEFAFPRQTSVADLLSERTVLDECYRSRIAAIVAGGPRFIGFSVHSFSQLFFALRGAAIVKETQSGIHICIGGAFLSKYYRRAHEFDSLLTNVDTVVLFSGQQPLLHILECLAAGREDFRHRNVWQPAADQSNQPEASPSAVENLPATMDFEGLPLKSYLAPHLIVSLPVTRGCHWRRCAFCSYNFQPYHEQDPAAVVEIVATLMAKYRTRWFYFSVSELQTSYLEALVDEIVKRQLDLRWTSLLRADANITPGLAARLYESGCRLLAVGIESASPRVLTQMNKGISPADARRVLINLHGARIAVIAYFMYGYPGESIDDLEQTLCFVGEHLQLFFGFVLSPFALTAGSPIAAKPSRYGIRIDDTRDDLAALMLCDGQLRWSCLPAGEGLQPEKSPAFLGRLLHLKRRLRNFYVHPDQYFPLRAPNDVFLSFLHLSRGDLAPGPGIFGAGNAFLDAIPFLDSKKVFVEVFSEDSCTSLSLGCLEAIPSDDKEVLLHQAATGRRLPLTTEIRELMMRVDGFRTVRQVVEDLRDSSGGQEESTLNYLSVIGLLYANRFLELRSA